MHKIAVLDDDLRWGLEVQQFFRNEFLVSVFTEPEPFLARVDQYQLLIVEFCLASTLGSARQIDGYCVISRLKATVSNPPRCLLVSGCMSYSDLEVIRDRPYCMADDIATKDSGLDTILKQTKQLLYPLASLPSVRSPQ